MAKETNLKENVLPGEQTGQEDSPDAELSGQSVSEHRVAELESLMARRDEALGKANARVVELEQIINSKESEVAGLKQSIVGLEQEVQSLSHSLAEAVAGYRSLVLQANPEVLDELIARDTVESINTSLNKAKTLVTRVRKGLETEITLTRVPAGAPERSSLDLSALSAREKIQRALGNLSSANR
jgi:uncharacterized coiled-coil protein SlyX